jgi:Protein of unknown function (DUF993)
MDDRRRAPDRRAGDGAAVTILRLPSPDGPIRYTLSEPAAFAPPAERLRSRVMLAAAHVVADPLGDNTPGSPAALDWDATLAYRRHLWRYGLGVAEAMDTAQRGMGLDWQTAQELIKRSAAEAAATGGRLVCGAGTDQLAAPARRLDEIVAAFAEQCEAVEAAGGQVVLMASRALAALARGPDDYHQVYGRVLRQVSRPVIVHWLGPMFDPAMRGYWGSADLDAATKCLLRIVTEHAAAVDGIKVSLLDAEREVALRRQLPDGVRLYTGDDFHYAELILGDDQGHSDAMLGILDAIAPVASTAVQALDAGDTERYQALLAPTTPLARHMFGAPTQYYKTGTVFLAWLAGHQGHFRMVGGLESARSIPHLVTLFMLADRAGLLPDPELAATRMRHLLAVAGVAP